MTTQPPFIITHTTEVREVVAYELIMTPVCPFGCVAVFVRETVIAWDFIVTATVTINPLYMLELAVQAFNNLAGPTFPHLTANSPFGSQSSPASTAGSLR